MWEAYRRDSGNAPYCAECHWGLNLNHDAPHELCAVCLIRSKADDEEAIVCCTCLLCHKQRQESEGARRDSGPDDGESDGDAFDGIRRTPHIAEATLAEPADQPVLAEVAAPAEAERSGFFVDVQNLDSHLVIR